MKDRTLLLHPPGFRSSVSDPYLAVPLLAAVLQGAGHECVCADLNVGFFFAAADPGVLADARDRVLRARATPRGDLLTKAELTALSIATDHVLETHDSLMQTKNGRRALLLTAELL